MRNRYAIGLAGVLCVNVLAAGAAPDWPVASGDDEAYLRQVAADTWACIAHFVEPSTGLPFDTSARGEYTSVTNLGYYAACCGVAAELGLVPRDEATQRVRRVFDAYGRFQKWHGFSQSWNHVRTLAPSPSDTMISVLDSGNMVAGFVVAGQLLPDVRADAERIIAAMDWTAVYDPADGRLFGGYDLARGRLDTAWHIGDYAGDGRMAAFWAIAVGAAPPESWGKLSREQEEHFELKVYRPAWLGGGLFMQSQDGLFLDERSTPIGRSAADFAYAQMLYAAHLELPAWGWSACQGPDGRYLGWGGLEVPVVTPHAAGMAALAYPHKAAECLRKLEKLGARAKWDEQGRSHDFGFRDSVNVETGAVCANYLAPLDQGMMLMALANVLAERVVQRAFMAHPTVQAGCGRIAEYGAPVDAAWLTELRRRDREPLPASSRTAARGPARVVVDDCADADPTANVLRARNSTWTRDATDDTVTVRLDHDTDAERGGCLRVDYDVDSPNAAFGGLTLDLGGADASGCDRLVFYARGAPAEFKLELHGRGGGGSTYVRGVSPDGWTRVEVPFIRLGGMITDWGQMHRIVIVFEDRVSQPKTGTLRLDDVRFEGGGK